jgi:hypothetical protein
MVHLHAIFWSCFFLRIKPTVNIAKAVFFKGSNFLLEFGQFFKFFVQSSSGKFIFHSLYSQCIRTKSFRVLSFMHCTNAQKNITNSMLVSANVPYMSNFTLLFSVYIKFHHACSAKASKGIRIIFIIGQFLKGHSPLKFGVWVN